MVFRGVSSGFLRLMIGTGFGVLVGMILVVWMLVFADSRYVVIGVLLLGCWVRVWVFGGFSGFGFVL